MWQRYGKYLIFNTVIDLNFAKMQFLSICNLLKCTFLLSKLC